MTTPRSNSPGAPDHRNIPHSRAIGMRMIEARDGVAVMCVPYHPTLVGNPATGVLHGGVITSVLDSASGAAVGSRMDRGGGWRPIATLDLRIDYMKPASPGRDLLARAECYKVTRNVAFVRGVAYHDDPADPIATTVATFMLSTPDRGPGAGSVAPVDPSAGASRGPRSMSEPFARLSLVNDHDSLRELLESTPYARLLGIGVAEPEGQPAATRGDGGHGPVFVLRFSEDLIGNTRLPAIHGGVIGGFLETAALATLVWASESEHLPKTIDITFEYLRSGRPRDTFARATITKHGRRVANVRVEAWQEDPERPIAAAHGHFLIKPKEPAPRAGTGA